jgi:hypothetical protein
MSTRWRECLQGPNSAILFLDVAEVRCRSWRFPKWKGISCQLIRLMECKMSMCQFTGDWSYHFAIWIENACTFVEMSCLACLAACTQSYVSSHATAKVIIFFRFPTTIWLIWHLEINLLCYCRNLNTCPTITSLVKLQKSKLFCLVLLLIFCRKSPVNLCFPMVIFLFSSIGLTTTLQPDGERCDEENQPLYAGCGASVIQK